jgi:hypothetical protein
MTDTAEISAAVADEIASWKRVFANCADGVDARELLRNAARELWSVLAIDATVHPETNGLAHQEIVDALQDMAESAPIPADDAQLIFAQYFKAPEEKNKTRGKRKSNDHKANPNWLDACIKGETQRPLPLAGSFERPTADRLRGLNRWGVSMKSFARFAMTAQALIRIFFSFQVRQNAIYDRK